MVMNSEIRMYRLIDQNRNINRILWLSLNLKQMKFSDAGERTHTLDWNPENVYLGQLLLRFGAHKNAVIANQSA